MQASFYYKMYFLYLLPKLIEFFAVISDDGIKYISLSDVNAKTYGDYILKSYDVSLGYNKDMFEVLDVGINGEFNFFNNIDGFSIHFLSG